MMVTVKEAQGESQMEEAALGLPFIAVLASLEWDCASH